MSTRNLFQVAALLFLVGCTSASPSTDELETQKARIFFDRSLAVTHEMFLEPFPLERVLDQLVSLSGVPITALDLFQQMWDTQNHAGMTGMPGPHCDDHITWQGQEGLNEFPWKCPRLEGFQATIDPFGDDPLYIPIGLFNRFDLAPASGAHCGEYRIVYAMRPGHPLAQGNQRNFIIFEAILPNPDPGAGLAACEPVAAMWADLSFRPDDEMAAMLEEFYFGDPLGFGPVVHPHNFGLMVGADGYACSSGQIRTNQFNDDPWAMREFKLALDCRCGPCDLKMIPLTVKTNPFADLFNVSTVEPLAPLLESTIVSQIHELSVSDVNRISYTVDDSLNAAESLVDGTDDYTGVASSNGPLHASIQAAIPPSSPLTSTHIIERALTQSCAGCHLLSDGRDLGDGVQWPHSLGFVHIEEFILPSGHYPISQALQDVFLPFRAELLMAFLDDPWGFSMGEAKECMLELPPELQVNDELCEEAMASESNAILVRSLVENTKVIRNLRTEWEGRAILGRRSGH